MICILSLVVFAILGIFSAKYRALAKEAFDCVFKRIQFKPCESGLDKKVKSKIIGKVFKKNKKLAGALSKHFETFSWVLVVLLVISFAFTANGIYNYIQYGNCNGPESTASCSFEAIQTSVWDKLGLKFNSILFPLKLEELSYQENPWIGAKTPELKIFEFGCFKCPYTARIQPEIDKLVSEYNQSVRVYFMHFPLTEHDNSMELATASECAQEQGKFWEFKEEVFMEVGTCTPKKTEIREEILNLARRTNLNLKEFKKCLKENEKSELVKQNRNQGIKLGVKKTPTLFIGNEKVEGYKTYEQLKRIVEKELKGD